MLLNLLYKQIETKEKIKKRRRKEQVAQQKNHTEINRCFLTAQKKKSDQFSIKCYSSAAPLYNLVLFHVLVDI